MKKIFLPLIILLISVISFQSCQTIGNLLNSRYKTASKKDKKENTPLEINLASLDKDFLNKEDTNVLFYRINADILKEVIRKSENKYTLCVSFNLMCNFAVMKFDSTMQFLKENNINFVVLEPTDWLYQKYTRYFFKQRKYYKPLLTLDLSKYGYDYDSRRRWRRFIKDLGIENYKDFYVNSEFILFDKDANIVFAGDFYDNKDKLKEYLDIKN
ncbi:MAG: hypothetical protein LBM25_04690 [Bacteroidales bacterium]|jgi:hypothetical protein|nr:hypothetical protein [Bacteroidales bacterium]